MGKHLRPLFAFQLSVLEYFGFITVMVAMMMIMVMGFFFRHACMLCNLI